MGEHDGVPRSCHGSSCRPDRLIKFQKVRSRIAIVSKPEGSAEGLGDEAELVDGEVPGLALALGGRMSGKARAPLGESLTDGPLTTEPQVTKGAWQGHRPRSGGWRWGRQAAIPAGHVTSRWQSGGVGP